MRSFSTARPARIRTAAGFTLLELVVTLVLLGLGAALVAPVFRRDSPPDDTLENVLAAAREQSVQRAQTLELLVGRNGAWRLTTHGDTAAIASGFARDVTAARHWRITALGACFDDSSSGVPGWDALACATAGDTAR